jgi:hypothetical protein
MKRLGLIASLLLMSSIFVNAAITKSEAEQIIRNFIKEKTDYNIDSIEVAQSKKMMTRLDIAFNDKLVEDEPSWFFFLDPTPRRLWGHTCKYIILSPTKGKIRVSTKEMYPENSEELFENIIVPKIKYPLDFDYKTHFIKPGLYTDKKTSNKKSNAYALLISGGEQKARNWQSTWNETSVIYQALTDLYGYKKENIVTLMTDGDDPAEDRHVGFEDITSPLDLDGDGKSDINGACNKANVKSEFEKLASKVTSNDEVYVYITSHGAIDYVALYGSGQNLNASELKRYLDNLNAKSIIVHITACHSGSFVDDLRGVNRTIVTSTSAEEVSWAGDYEAFFEKFIGGLTGTNLYTGEVVDCDVNNDEEYDLEESFVYGIGSTYETQISHLETRNHQTPHVWTYTSSSHSVNINAGSGRIMSGATLTANNKISNADIVYQASNKVLLKGGFKYKQSGKAKFKCIAGGDCLRKLDVLPEIEDEIFELEDFFEFNSEISDIDDAISEAEKISIYPNPTDGVLNISISNGSIDNIVVSDITGKVLVEKTVNADQAEIDLSSYNKGIYIVKVVTENDSYIEKVVLK